MSASAHDQAQHDLLLALARQATASAEALERDNADERASADEAKVFTFVAEIEPCSVGECIETLGEWHRKEPNGAITLAINSPGGSVFDGLALFDYLRWLVSEGHEVTTLGIGQIFSMSAVILQAGSRRVMAPNAWLMIHEVSTIVAGKGSQLSDESKLIERVQNQLLEILAAQSEFSTRQVKNRWNRKDWYLTAAEALKHGFIDAIQE